MAKKNHHSLKYKMASQPNKTYKDLKQKQKLKISEWMFWEVCEYFREKGSLPPDDELEPMAQKIFVKIRGAAIWVPFDDVLAEFRHKQPRFAERIAEQGLPDPPVPKQKKTEAEKLAIKRMRRKNKKKKEKERLESSRVNPDQDDRFFFIAGYTSGSAPYGVTWEEMGLAPYEDLCDPNAED